MTHDTTHVVSVTKSLQVLVDGEGIGTLEKRDRNTYHAYDGKGRRIITNGYAFGGARYTVAGMLARDLGFVAPGESYITADDKGNRVGGGPWTVAEAPVVDEPTFAEGTRVRLTNPVDRYPHFCAEAGATGTVTDVSTDSVSVKMDVHLPGAEEWDNEIVWSLSNGDDPLDDLEAVTDEPTFALTVYGDEGTVAPKLTDDRLAFHCPKCDDDDVHAWAEDGEADLADYWECDKCDNSGALVLVDDATKTQNGHDAAPAPMAWSAIVVADRDDSVVILPVEVEIGSEPIRVADGIVAFHGDTAGASLGVVAPTRAAAYRMIADAFPMGCVDDLDEAANVADVIALAERLSDDRFASDAFLAKVEDAWYDATKGEIAVTGGDDVDAELRDWIVATARYTKSFTDTVAAAQYDAGGNEIASVDDAEIARRVVSALSTLCYGTGA